MTHSFDLTTLEQQGINRSAQSGLLRDIFNRADIDSPQLFMSRSAIAENYQNLKAALPRVDIHYAIKPNNHGVILDEVHRLGGNFDICSAGEIDMVLRTGVDPSTLVHSHPIKSIPEFDYAVSNGIEIFVVDNAEEVKKLHRYPERKLKVMIRYRISTNSMAVVNLQYKFGCQVTEVLSLAREIEKSGHEFYGLCFHIGSQCLYSENYVLAIKAAHSLIHQLDECGFNTRLLDIGGGFPVEYVEPAPDIHEFCQPIATALDEHIRPGIKVISEPGRFIAASPVTLVCTILGKAERDGKCWYYLDDGLYSTFSGILFDHCQYPVITNKTGEHRLSVLSGPTCDSFDVMYDGLMIPEHNVGDRMVFCSTGAYCAVSGSNFNALKQASYQIID
ncbi:MAG: type III PLP-dependent enzyme [bacterium]|nr:type III PLP-dependent enzyme [bacterium]